MKKILLSLLLITLTACVGIPDKIKPVNNFKIEKYLGKWYEIARLDHSFERGLNQISAEYSLNPDGSLKVLNKGFSKEDNQWKQAEGKAYFVEQQTTGHLQVSFFGPFYSSYIIFELDHENYQYALISGYDKSYFWLLSRQPKIPENLKSVLLAKAASLGFDTSKLIFPEQP